MIHYNISDKFNNDDVVNYPFNIMNSDGQLINDFWEIIHEIADHIVNDNTSKVRFVWIEAESYCQTEVFLKRILLPHHKDYPVLYLHWIDFINQGITINTKVNQVMIDNKYFSNQNTLKICVIDHAETIGQIDQYTELCDKFSDNPCIFIFLSKKGSEADINYWLDLIRSSQNTTNNNLGIIRSESNFYLVKPYSIDICKKLISNAIHNKEVRLRSLETAETTLNYEMRRPYYFDLLISVLRQCNSQEEVPIAFNDTLLLENIYSKAIRGIVGHLTGESTLDSYIQGYYKSDFVKKSGLDKQKRIPIDNYAWAYGIISYTPSVKKVDYYKKAIALTFKANGEDYNTNSFDQMRGINKHIVTIKFERSEEINKLFDLNDYLRELASYNLFGALICATVLNDCFDQVDVSIRRQVFITLGTIYRNELGDRTKIRMHVLLGLELGKLLPKIPNQTIAESMGYFFDRVTDNYVLPVCNKNGIAVISLTNFEFEKFVKDGGYQNYYNKEFAGPLNKIAVTYYKEIFDFIVGALDGLNTDDSKCLALLLKGYDWLQYKQIAYLFAQKSAITTNEIFSSIETNNYPLSLEYPAKWADRQNSQTTRPFCNPLQPVICINLFEARAYANWLSDKIGMDVRIMKYDPDYLSIIGSMDSDEDRIQRDKFLKYLDDKSCFINSAEHSQYFYGSDDIEIRELSPMAIPDTQFLELFDFVGNVFETQDTHYNYYYPEEISERSIQEFQKKERAVTDYNCPGGGFQRTKANWPPEYMGQAPAFLRNQDIGFRIVINGKGEGHRQFENFTVSPVKYDESSKEIFTLLVTKHNSGQLLDNVTITSKNNELNKSDIYVNKTQSVVLFSIKNYNDNTNVEFIMLLASGECIYAYHLKKIATIKTDEVEKKISIIARKPISPESLAARKRCNNQSKADWIELLIMEGNFLTNYFQAYPLNVCNGSFVVPDLMICQDIVDGVMHEKISTLSGEYKISYVEHLGAFRSKFYNGLKSKLGVDFFLPDWIDIVDFIGFLSSTIDIKLKLNVEIIFAAITTIDTADLHEQINKKKLLAIEERMKRSEQ